MNVTILTGDLDNDDVKDTSGITLSWRDIKGNNSAAVIRSKKCTEKAVLDGFTVTGGDGPKDGGGMYNLSSSPRISRCTFVGNRAQANGGGMANRESSPIVENCTFERNRAGKGGGGMFNFGRIGKTKDFVPVVEGCVFSENSSELHGGGMSSMAASPRVADSSFVGNVVSSDTNKDVRGGALYFYYDAQGEVTNSSFLGNTASTTHPKSRGLGGGIAVLERSHVTLSGCTFSQNRSTHCGGGFFQSVGSPIFTNCTFFRNESSKGGGLYAENGGTSIPPTAPILAHCTFFKNAADEGGALYAAQEVRPAILNGVLWENDGGEIGYHDKVGSFLVTHCVIRGNYVIPRGGVFEDIVSADAKLLPLAGNGGRTETCALQTGSSAIDSGMNGLQMAAWLRKSLRLPEQRIGWLLSCVSADQRGLKRSGAPDAGAYESNATVPGDSFVISAAADVGGSIRPSGEISVRRGEDQAFAVSADKGFRIASIRIDGAPLSLDADGTYVYTFRDVSADHSILAGFEEICFTKLEVVGNPVVRVRGGEICSFGFRLVGDAGVETVRNVSAEYRNKAGLPLSGEKWSWFVKLPVTSVDIPMTFKPKAGIEDGTLTLNVTLRNGSLLSASLSLTVLSGDVPQPQPQPQPRPAPDRPQPQPRPAPDRPQP
ncbi:MAG: right-handed parallel beta-helix repeat-containing protein, partial [Fretibacterium sp.]|nr:right-handed parallel beta-helix repeat-containing protein [Fretibacterium sp.]